MPYLLFMLINHKFCFWMVPQRPCTYTVLFLIPVCMNIIYTVSFPTNLGALTFYSVHCWGFQFSFKQTKTTKLVEFFTYNISIRVFVYSEFPSIEILLHPTLTLLFCKLLICILIRYWSVSTCNLFCHFCSHSFTCSAIPSIIFIIIYCGMVTIWKNHFALYFFFVFALEFVNLRSSCWLKL